MALTIKQITHALRAKSGNVTEAAQGLGITRYGLQKRIARSDELRQLVQDEREAIVDMAESAIRGKIREGDTASIIYTLKTQGGARGWSEQYQLKHSGETVLRIVYGDDGTDDPST